jgi:NAD(P)-dependent dehydrogenase (short-subunit alcohol dehydrogenase family)
VETFGRLDCAFNNAGVEGKHAATADCSEENWDYTIEVNLKGVWLCMKYEMKQMLKQGGKGAIVNTASVAGVVAERGLPAYAASKGGVIQLTRTAAVEYAGTGLRINAVCPGLIMTPMIDRALAGMSIETLAPGTVRRPVMRSFIDKFMHMRPMQQQMVKFLQPMGRPGQPNEIAEAVVWLCSDAASFVTGHAMMIDGGMTAA